MYENLSEYEKALMYFGNRVDVICALEISRKIDAETAYKSIKQELKELKKVRKEYKKEM